jgi:hypothetical protein
MGRERERATQNVSGSAVQCHRLSPIEEGTIMMNSEWASQSNGLIQCKDGAREKDRKARHFASRMPAAPKMN